MRLAVSAFVLLATASLPALAGNMRQSPLLGHKAGEACAPGHRRSASGPTYRMAGCLPTKR